MRSHTLFLIISMMSVSVSSVHAQTIVKSTQDDQARVEVTVYNGNLGLIKDIRDLKLPQGEGELRFMDVASAIRPVTVHVRSVNNPGQFHVLEQNYEYDLIDYNKLLNKYVGHTIKLMDRNQYQDRKDITEAILVSNNNNSPVYEINNEIYLGHPGYHILPRLPENLIAKPTLTWLYANQAPQGHQIEVSYLTRDITWQADYIFVLNPDDTKGDLSGWVTIDNKSGAMYKQAQLKLVAGEVEQLLEDYLQRPSGVYKMLSEEATAPQFAQENFFEYHLYDLQRPTTIKDKETKQISLLEAVGIMARKELLVDGTPGYFVRYYRPQDQDYKQPVMVYVHFKNSQENQLGMPLPAGVLRLYKKDSKGSLQFVGEDRIKHTPKDEEIKVKVGEAFDVVAERRQISFKQLTTQMYESVWEITLRNHKDKDVDVAIIEPLQGSWQIMEESHPYRKLDAFNIRFDVRVPKDIEVKVTYKVRVGI